MAKMLDISLSQETWGKRTLGIKHFLQAQNVMFVASGRGKADNMKRTVESPPDTGIPTMTLKLHPNFYLMLDREVALL